MFDVETTTLLRSVLNEVCTDVGQYESGVRAHVASALLAAATFGPPTGEQLRQAGLDAVKAAPTMWR
jgi:hypothetical protein